LARKESLGTRISSAFAAYRGEPSKHAPWFVVPADNKWFTRLVVAAAIAMTLEKFDLAYPEVSGEMKKELADARKALANQA